MEDREFRIFASEVGDVPVVRDIVGEDELAQRLIEVRNCYPASIVSVREVFERVAGVYHPARRNGAEAVYSPTHQPAPKFGGH